MNTDAMIAFARECIGTPFAHQARIPHVGLDCAGLVVLSVRAAGGEIKDQTNYSRIPDGSFKVAIEEHCDKIGFEDLRPGDFVTFKFEKRHQHIGIISGIEPLTMIHSWAQMRKVTENSVDDYWLTKLAGCYRLKE